MALKLSVDTLDGIDDAFKPLYIEKDGKFSLQVDGIEDTAGLKTALQKERKTASDLEKQTKAWKSIGKTPEEIAELIEAQEVRERTEAERRGDFDKILAQVNEKNAKLLEAERTEKESLRSKYKSEVIDREAISAIAAERGSPELLLPIVQKFIKVDDNDNALVVDAKGDPRVGAKGEPMTISDLVKEMRASDVYGRAFEGSGQSGSGTRPSNGNAGGPGGRITKADLKVRADRAAYVDAHGHDAYFALPDK